MNYFYLKGLDKIGPLTIDELKEVSLTDDTLIWYEGLNEWTKFSGLIELKKEIIGEIENFSPPIPENIIEEQKKLKKEIENIEIKKNKSKLLQVIVSFLVIIIFLLVFFIIHKNNIKTDKQSLIDKIDLIFQNKISVCDFENYAVTGKLTKLTKPVSNGNDNNYTYNYLNIYENKVDKGIVEEYSLKLGGFSIYKITKEDNGYVVELTKADDMIYKVGEYEYSDYGYSMPTYRPSVENCYVGALKHLTTENQDSNYVANIYSKIKNFHELKSKYFHIVNTAKPTSPNLNNWEETGGSVYTSQYAVYFNAESWYYEISEYSKDISKNLITNLIIGFVLGLILTVITNIFWNKFLINVNKTEN